MPTRLIEVPSVKFEIFVPTSYYDNKTKTTKFVQRTEIVKYLVRMTKKYKSYGGYTISNPIGAPPYAGGYRGGQLERNTLIMLIIPDHLLAQAEQDVKQMVTDFQSQYQQMEILSYHYSIVRYMPSQTGQQQRYTP